jgi:hypothetical protein
MILRTFGAASSHSIVAISYPSSLSYIGLGSADALVIGGFKRG